MKKNALLLGAFIILSTTSLAWGGYARGGGCMGYGFWGRMTSGWHHMTEKGRNYPQRDLKEERLYLEVREKNFEVYDRYGKQINQKQLEVERELLKEKPDWKKVSTLNEEIAQLEARAKTEMMRNGY